MLGTIVIAVLLGVSSGLPAPSDEAAVRLGPSKILNGIDAVPGQFPYMASLDGCGASILTKDWALTAAHCCRNPEMKVYVGSIYLSQGGVYHPITRFIHHFDWGNYPNYQHDICLIELQEPLEFSTDVQPVKLPPQDMPVASGDNVTVVGWGADQTGNGPDRLQILNYHAVSNEECNEANGNNVHDGQICAVFGRNLSTCSGDSGSPLTRNGVQVGLVSWGYIPCGVGHPDVYTRVPYYINWIQETMGAAAAELLFADAADL